MIQQDALMRLADSASEAAGGVLEMFAAGKVQRGEIAVLESDRGPLDGLPFPAVATSVGYIDGVTGGNLFVMTLEGAQRLAAAMMGAEEPEDPNATELSEFELSAVSEAMNQMMASAAGAISTVLGTEVEIGVPETRVFASVADTAGAYPEAPHVVRAAFSIFGEPCRLVQLVPNAFVLRMDQALKDIASTLVHETDGGGRPAGSVTASPSLSGINVRVWAELGRASLATAEVVGLPTGAVVELDRAAEEPIDLYVNGHRFATGRLLVVDGQQWAVRIEALLAPAGAEHPYETGVAAWPES
jgi:flagellar motor switch protein FliN/FliY